jgi:hypothetical protein
MTSTTSKSEQQKPSANGRPQRYYYEYQDEQGQTLSRVVRVEPGRDGRTKDIYQQRPDGEKWRNGISGIRHVPYRLPQLLRQDIQRSIFIVEGEKKVDALWGIDVAATCNQGGAGKWLPEFAEHFQDRHVVILPDNDDAGRKHAQQVAANLLPVAASVRILELPELPPKGDIVDWLRVDGHDKTKLLQLMQGATELVSGEENASAEAAPAADADAARPPKLSTATQLVAMAQAAGVTLTKSPDGHAYMTIDQGGRRETLLLRSRAARLWLRLEYYRQQERSAGSQAIEDALGILEGKAHLEGKEVAVHVRLAGQQDRIHLDLADAAHRIIEIDVKGWRLATGEQLPLFRRPRGLLALPMPDEGGKLDDLRQLLNIKDNSDWYLYVAWLVAALRPQGPYPVLCWHGLQGSAKSTHAKFTRLMIDPSAALLRAEPRDPRDVMIAATNGRVVALDNLSHIPSWLSDCLCRLSTGGGFATRELYSDTEETIFEAQRPVVLTSIEEIASRCDLLDRSIVLTLPPIPEKDRKPESKLLADFEAARPKLLGSLLTALSGAMALVGGVQLQVLPRMADFAILGEAVGKTLRWPEAAFQEAYRQNRRLASEIALDGSVLVPHLVELVRREPWQGAAGELLQALRTLAGDAAGGREWPASPRGMTGAIRRLAPALSSAGLVVEFERSGRQRRITIRSGGGDGDGCSAGPSPQPSPQPSPAKPAENPEKSGVGDGCDGCDGRKQPCSYEVASQGGPPPCQQPGDGPAGTGVFSTVTTVTPSPTPENVEKKGQKSGDGCGDGPFEQPSPQPSPQADVVPGPWTDPQATAAELEMTDEALRLWGLS